MKWLLCVLAALVLIGGAALEAAPGQARGRGQGQDAGRGKDERSAAAKSAPNRPAVNVVFVDRDITLIRTHYGNRFKNLPRGQQMRLARGKPLPPGWQKTIEGFPASLERQLPVLGSGHKYGVYDGHAVIYDPLTHAILDIVSLF